MLCVCNMFQLREVDTDVESWFGTVSSSLNFNHRSAELEKICIKKNSHLKSVQRVSQICVGSGLVFWLFNAKIDNICIR